MEKKDQTNINTQWRFRSKILKWRNFTVDELEEAWKYKLSSKDVKACKYYLPNWPHWVLIPVLTLLPLKIVPPIPQEEAGRNLLSPTKVKSSRKVPDRNLLLSAKAKLRRRKKKIDYQDTESDEEMVSDSESQQPSEDCKDSNSSSNVKQKKIVKKKKKISKKSMTEFEKKIQKNIEERMAFIESLKLDEAKQSFLELVKKPKKIYKKVPLPPPREKSSRLLQKEKIFWNVKVMFNEAEKKAKEEARKEWKKHDLMYKICRWHMEMEENAKNINDENRN